MKRIVKRKPPRELVRWLRRQKGTNCSYGDLQGSEKQPLVRKLLREQGSICGYTGIRNTETTCHVEHIYPQTRCRAEPGLPVLWGARRDVDYYNMIAAFPRDEAIHARYPFGARSRGDWYDEVAFIHPLRPDCESQFLYTLDGGIAPSDGDPEGPAARTIGHLRLDHSVLNELRRAAIEEMLFDDGEPISVAKVQIARKHVCAKDAAGDFRPFCFVLEQACRELLASADRERTRRKAIERQARRRR
jgi:uncharacterized protein (TIGR02646 family)